MATATASASAMAKRAKGLRQQQRRNDDDDERAHLPRGNWTSCNIAAAFLQHRLAHGHDSCAAERDRDQGPRTQGRAAAAETQRVDRPHPPKFESVCNWGGLNEYERNRPRSYENITSPLRAAAAAAASAAAAAPARYMRAVHGVQGYNFSERM